MMKIMDNIFDYTEDIETSESEFSNVENRLNLKLPFDFKKFMTKFNGEIFDEIILNTEIGEYKINELIEVEYIVPSVITLYNKIKNNKDNLCLVPFGKYKDNYFCLDYTFSPISPCIVVVDSFEDYAIKKIVPSFYDFINNYLCDNNIFREYLISEGNYIQKKINANKDISINSANLIALEEIIEGVMAHKSVTFPENGKRALNKEFACNCEKIIITKSDDFFGACIYPSLKQLNCMADKIIECPNGKIKFENCKDFIIELDERMLFSNIFTAREVLAAILHEVGHKVFSNKYEVEAIFNITKLFPSVVNFSLNLLKRFSPLKWLLFEGILVFFNQTLRFSLSNHTEILADTLPIRYGYGNDLYSLIDKIAKLPKLATTKKDNEKIASWSIMSMISFNNRKNEIERSLKTELKETQSAYQKEIILYQLNKLNSIKKPIVVSENKFIYSFNEESILLENLNNFVKDIANSKAIKDLDAISLEMDRIEDQEDKIYCMMLIHKMRKKVINYQEELNNLNSKNKISETEFKKKMKLLDDYLKEVDKLRMELLKVKIKEKKYGVFAKIGIEEYDAL